MFNLGLAFYKLLTGGGDGAFVKREKVDIYSTRVTREAVLGGMDAEKIQGGGGQNWYDRGRCDEICCFRG